MEGEGKSKVGLKRKDKVVVEVGTDSGDDETIGSFLKLKSKRKGKKVKVGSDGSGDKLKVAEKLVVEDDNVFGMDNTLASFWRKLRVPKKDGGSTVKVGRSLVSEAEPSGQSADGGVNDGDAAVNFSSSIADKQQGNGDGGSSHSLSNPVKDSSRRKSRKPRVALELKGDQDEYKLEDATRGQRSISVLPMKVEEGTLGSGDGSASCLDDKSDDSLSAFFRKAQSGLTKKVRISSRLKTERELQASAGILDNPRAVSTSKSRSSVKVVKSIPDLADNLHVEHICSTGTVASNQGLDDTLTAVSNSIPLGAVCSEPSQVLTSELHNGVVQFDDNVEEMGYEATSVNSAPDSSSLKCQSSLMPCSNEITSALVGERDCWTSAIQKGSPKQAEDNHVYKNVSTGGADNLVSERKVCSALGNNAKNSSSDRKEQNEQLEDVPPGACRNISGEGMDPLSSQFQVSSACTDLTSKSVKPFDGCDSNQPLRECSQAGRSGMDDKHRQPSSRVCNLANSIPADVGKVSDNVTSHFCYDATSPEVKLSQFSVREATRCESREQMERQDKSLEKADVSNSFREEVILRESKECSPALCRTEISVGASTPIHGEASAEEVANGSPSPNVSDHLNSPAEDSVLVPNLESENKSLLDHQRATRISKKRRHQDMAYEGDVDWEVLHQQEIRHRLADVDQTFKLSDASLSLFSDSESGVSAAVSVGLKARSISPIEKIKFKEALRRKGGLQEYLECRNHILSLWNKDVSRLLPLTECGVRETPSVDEPQRTSLVRDVYSFLDQHGYINFGVASMKDKEDNGGGHNLKIFTDEKFGEKARGHVCDTEDGVSFIMGKVKISDSTAVESNELIPDFEKEAMRAEADMMHVNPKTLDLSSPIGTAGCASLDSLENCLLDEKPFDRRINVDSFDALPSSKDANGNTLSLVPPGLSSANEAKLDGAVSFSPSELPKVSSDLQCVSIDSRVHEMQCDSEAKKRIIVVGAGPAGLTAARHLQRQGFHITVLEARSRIGGRVFTDRSSLSVPVDLGASIITGVEADVATERRADPSSVICAQLGLELTVLNSDCPLYDTVTGQKVPEDLDEALEAEYNSLLDDMILLVAQRGEHAMRMSLEEGLEFALKRRRRARARRNYLDDKSVDINVDSGKFPADEVPEDGSSKAETLSPLERRVMDWHFANLEYGCAALLKEVSLPYWNQDDLYGGFGGAHCMIKGGYSAVVDSLAGGLCVHLNHVVTDVSYFPKDHNSDDRRHKVKVSTSNGSEFVGDAVLITVPLGCLKRDAIKFSPPLPHWKSLSIERLGFGVLNKVVLEFPEVFWDDNLDYFGATAEETNIRGQCFMFWNVKKTVGAPVLIALVVGKAAIDDKMRSSDHVNHALVVLRKLFGDTRVPDPVASVVTNWGKDPYSYGAYSYVAVGSSGEDYDILGRPVEDCLFFAGEATCKEHPDTVGGAMMSGLREAVRIIDILTTGVDHTAEVEAVESAERHSDLERNEVRDIITRLEAVELSTVLCKNSLDHAQILTREGLLKDMFFNAKTTAGRLHLVKELLNLPVTTLKSFAGTREGLSTLNSWILDSMGKDGTQLLRHCVRLLVRVSTDLLAIRLSGIGKTVKEKVCVHTSRDIRAIASQLVNVWVEIFRKEKASNGKLKLLRLSSTSDSLKSKSNLASAKPPLRMNNHAYEHKGSPKMVNSKPAKLDRTDSKSEVRSSSSQGSAGKRNVEETQVFPLSEEEKAAFAAAEAARAAALAAAEAYASSGVQCNMPLPLPKIPSFNKFARREQYARMDESDIRRNWSGGGIGKQDCLSEIDSRNCRVRDWSVDFSAAGVNLDSSRMSFDDRSQRSHSNETACQMNFREHSGESAPVDTSLLTKAWVDSSGSVEGKDYSAIERWQCQAAAANFEFYQRTLHVTDEEDSNMGAKLADRKPNKFVNESSASQVTVNKELVDNQRRGPESIKQGVVDYVASLLMPLYKARKIDKEGYKSIMKKTATKVMERTTDAEKAMSVAEFLDFKRKNKIRPLVDKLIEKHMAKPVAKS